MKERKKDRNGIKRPSPYEDKLLSDIRARRGRRPIPASILRERREERVKASANFRHVQKNESIKDNTIAQKENNNSGASMTLIETDEEGAAVVVEIEAAAVAEADIVAEAEIVAEAKIVAEAEIVAGAGAVVGGLHPIYAATLLQRKWRAYFIKNLCHEFKLYRERSRKLRSFIDRWIARRVHRLHSKANSICQS